MNIDEVVKQLLEVDIFVEIVKKAEKEDLLHFIRAASEELYYREKVGE